MFKHMIRVYRDIYKIDKRFVWIQIFYGIFFALVPLLTLYFSQRIINALRMEASWASVQSLVIQSLLLLAFSLFFRTFFDNLYSTAVGNFNVRCRFHQNEKLLSMKYEHIEDAKVEQLKSDLRILSYSSANTIISHGTSIRSKFHHLLTIVLAIVLLVPVFQVQSHTFWDSWWVLGGLLFILIVMEMSILWFNQKAAQQMSVVQNEIFEANNLFDYLLSMIYQHDSGKEIRLYNQQPQINEMIDHHFVKGGITKVLAKAYQLLSRINSYSLTIHSLFSLLVYILIGSKALLGNLGIGYVVSSIGAINLLVTSIPQLLSEITRSLMEPHALEKYYEFMDLPEDVTVGSLPIEKRLDAEYQLSVNGLSFSYPNSNKRVLNDITIDFDIGKSYAIVGENGSGKTTFIKLLTRLYPTEMGSITLNGIDVQKYDPKQYFQLFNVVFQDFSLFGFKLDETIATSKEVDRSRIQEVLKEVGFEDRLQKMPLGLDTMLSKEFDPAGVQLSGGEEQKVALARALYKDGPIFILDEPTAALDPISEFEIYKHFQQMIKGHTSILISHRLSSCRLADEIIVFDQGQIVQQGTHDQLVQQAGKYQELWTAQAQFYQEQDFDLTTLLGE